MKRTIWRDVLVFVAAILFLLCVATPLVFGQDCPPGGCPSPRSQGPIHQIFGGRSGGSWGVWSEGGQALPDRSRRQHPTAPEFIVKLSGASGVLFYKNERAGVILTAQHVIRGEQNLSVVFPDGERHAATVIQGQNGETATDSIWDVAFLEIPSPSARHCRVAEGPPSIGEAVRICGYGHDRIYAETTGTVKEFAGDPRRRTEGSKTMVLSGEAKPGDSGGPIFNSKGELIGVVSASTWNNPMQADETISPALSRIYEMCQSRVYLWPWNARTEQERIRSESAVEQERIRSQAEVEQERLRSQGQQQPLPYPIQPSPPSVDVNVEVGKKLEPLEKTVKEQGETLGKHQEKIDYFDQIVVSIKEKTAVLEKSGSEFDKMLAARVREVQADVLAELTPKVEEAAAAVDSKAGAVAETVAGKVAGKAAEEAVEKATPGLFDKLKGLLPTGLVEKIDGLKNLLATHSWVLGGLVIVVILLVFKDIKDFVKTGGEDKLMIQKLAGMTPWQWDDRLAERVASRLEKRFEKPEPAAVPPV